MRPFGNQPVAYHFVRVSRWVVFAIVISDFHARRSSCLPVRSRWPSAVFMLRLWSPCTHTHGAKPNHNKTHSYLAWIEWQA